MTVRVSRAAIDAMRALIEEHLRREYAWPGGASFEDTEIHESDFADFLHAALEYACAAHPLLDRRGAALDVVEIARDPTSIELFSALLDLEPRTPEACIAALVKVVPLDILDAGSGRRAAAPRLYPSVPHDWPDVLGVSVGEREHDVWSENVFGVVTEPGWLHDRTRRAEVFAAVDPLYRELSFLETDRKTAHRLACFLLAGADNRAAFKSFERQASALVSLFGAGTRVFSNREFERDELRDPFAHGEPVDLGTHHQCAGASLLALLVSDGGRVARLEALWDRWTES
jgi:hypothetical protein